MKFQILISYWYFKKTDLDQLITTCFPGCESVEVFADSGAFSAMNRGAEIDVKEYADWIKRWSHRIDLYANLDVIKDPIGTERNQKTLEDLGLSPLPVFHVLTEWQILERMVEAYPYIGLGIAGMGQRKHAVMRWLNQAFAIGKEKAVFHGFGITNWQPVRSFPWYSLDSSSWGRGYRFGTFPIFDDQKGEWLNVHLRDRKNCYTHAGVIRSYGFNPEDFADKSRNDRGKIAGITALAFHRLESYLRDRHGSIKIPGGAELETGVKIYLAETKGRDYRLALDAIQNREGANVTQ